MDLTGLRHMTRTHKRSTMLTSLSGPIHGNCLWRLPLCWLLPGHQSGSAGQLRAWVAGLGVAELRTAGLYIALLCIAMLLLVHLLLLMHLLGIRRLHAVLVCCVGWGHGMASKASCIAMLVLLLHLRTGRSHCEAVVWLP